MRNAGCMDWTDAAIERLKELWSDGHSGSEVAKLMGGGLTRCAILGKIHRLGLSHKYRRRRERAPRMRAKAKTAHLLTDKIAGPILSGPEMPPPTPPTGGFGLLDLRHGMCRWPEGDRDYRFCGAPQARDSSYCLEHHAMAHNRGSQRDFDRAAEQALAGKLFASRAGVDEAA